MTCSTVPQSSSSSGSTIPPSPSPAQTFRSSQPGNRFPVPVRSPPTRTRQVRLLPNDSHPEIATPRRQQQNLPPFCGCRLSSCRVSGTLCLLKVCALPPPDCQLSSGSCYWRLMISRYGYGMPCLGCTSTGSDPELTCRVKVLLNLFVGVRDVFAAALELLPGQGTFRSGLDFGGACLDFFDEVMLASRIHEAAVQAQLIIFDSLACSMQRRPAHVHVSRLGCWMI